MSGLAAEIDPRRDDVRLYALPEQPKIDVLGRSILPDGVFAPLPGVPSDRVSGLG
jgi:hypothetical protein